MKRIVDLSRRSGVRNGSIVDTKAGTPWGV